MNPFLVPSGEIEFHGDMDQLLHAIKKANGILMRDQQFTCSIPYPKRKGLYITFIRRPVIMPGCQFYCKYEVAPSGFRISYQVWPTFLSLLLMLTPPILAIASFIQYRDVPKGCYSLLLFGIVMLALGCFYVLERREHIARFLDAFK